MCETLPPQNEEVDRTGGRSLHSLTQVPMHGCHVSVGKRRSGAFQGVQRPAGPSRGSGGAADGPRLAERKYAGETQSQGTPEHTARRHRPGSATCTATTKV